MLYDCHNLCNILCADVFKIEKLLLHYICYSRDEQCVTRIYCCQVSCANVITISLLETATAIDYLHHLLCLFKLLMYCFANFIVLFCN